ncbi:MAG: RDD family protein, partial [Chloroflexota bacterium]|nr:RDD family protein [Chloroflexota bacterium]
AYLPLAAVLLAVSSREPSSEALTAIGLAAVAAYTASIGYLGYTLVQLGRGRSPGKTLLGLWVIHLESGEPAGFRRMLLREVVGKWASAVVLFLGFFWALWDEQEQGWHDKVARTVVVRDEAPSEVAVREDPYRTGF